METAIYVLIGLCIWIVGFQLYQWIMVKSAEMDLLRATADTIRHLGVKD